MKKQQKKNEGINKYMNLRNVLISIMLIQIFFLLFFDVYNLEITNCQPELINDTSSPTTQLFGTQIACDFNNTKVISYAKFKLTNDFFQYR